MHVHTTKDDLNQDIYQTEKESMDKYVKVDQYKDVAYVETIQVDIQPTFKKKKKKPSQVAHAEKDKIKEPITYVVSYINTTVLHSIWQPIKSKVIFEIFSQLRVNKGIIMTPSDTVNNLFC